MSFFKNFFGCNGAVPYSQGAPYIITLKKNKPERHAINALTYWSSAFFDVERASEDFSTCNGCFNFGNGFSLADPVDINWFKLYLM